MDGGAIFSPCVDVALVSHARTWGTEGIPAPLHGPTLIIPAPRALIVVVVKPPCLNELDSGGRRSTNLVEETLVSSMKT